MSLFLRVRNECWLRRGKIHPLNRSRIYGRVATLSFRSGPLSFFWDFQFGGGQHRYIEHACRCGRCWSGQMARYPLLNAFHDIVLNGPLPLGLQTCVPSSDYYRCSLNTRKRGRASRPNHSTCPR